MTPNASVPQPPIRVLIVAPSLDILGGQAVQADRLLQYLSSEPGLAMGFLPVNPRLPGPLAALQKIKYLRTIVTELRYAAALLTTVRRYDVIHIFSASYFSFLLAPTPAILAARLYGKRIVLNYRSGEAEDHLARWPSAIATLRMAGVIAVPSAYLVDVFARFGLRARAVFNVVDRRRFRFRLRSPLRPVFLTNRGLEPMYNVECVLRAFATIQKRVPEARLIVANDGGSRRSLESLARQLDLKNAEFVGRVSQERSPTLYDSADIFLNGSDIDNMPGSLLECFAAGLPVVTTDAGGIPYIVADGETGLLVHRGDHQAMAAAALRLLAEPSLAERLAQTAHRQCELYTWDAVKNQWLDLYRGATVAQTSLSVS